MRLILLTVVLAIGPYCPADEVKSGFTELESPLAKTSRHAGNDVEQELLCIRDKTEGKLEFIKQKQALEMIKRLAKPLQAGFKKFGFSSLARAQYYAQAIEESGGFTQLSEAKKFAKAGDDPVGHLIVNHYNDEDFKVNKASAAATAFASHSYGEFRGRGLIQITGCDNYLSIIHYLNQMYAGQTPHWKAYWDYPAGENKRKQIGAVCTKEQQRRIQAEYWNTQNMNPNLYGAFMEPMNFAAIGMKLKDPVSKKTIDSEEFMVDASLAYWEGRCGERARNATSQEKLAAFAPCDGFKGEYLDQVSKCLTECIKGNTKGWEKRRAWLKKALVCMR